jgi:hypothetical protein
MEKYPFYEEKSLVGSIPEAVFLSGWDRARSELVPNWEQVSNDFTLHLVSSCEWARSQTD